MMTAASQLEARGRLWGTITTLGPVLDLPATPANEMVIILFPMSMEFGNYS